jgi:hypothetical protein
VRWPFQTVVAMATPYNKDGATVQPVAALDCAWIFKINPRFNRMQGEFLAERLKKARLQHPRSLG